MISVVYGVVDSEDQPILLGVPCALPKQLVTRRHHVSLTPEERNTVSCLSYYRFLTVLYGCTTLFKANLVKLVKNCKCGYGLRHNTHKMRTSALTLTSLGLLSACVTS